MPIFIAGLVGVNVKMVTLFAFCSMGVLAALSGILYTSRLQSATPTAGLAFEMDAIASLIILQLLLVDFYLLEDDRREEL